MGAQFSPRTPLAIKRGKKRTRLVAPAILLAAGGELEARIRDLSRSGALAEAAPPPAAQSQIVLVLGGLVVPAIVAWVVGRRFGLEFDTLIGEEDVAAYRSAQQLI